jgi:MFS transporter, PHS family, inorganic phosphate transporter
LSVLPRNPFKSRFSESYNKELGLPWVDRNSGVLRLDPLSSRNQEVSVKTETTATDETNLRSFQWRMVFTAGMGFFTDAYDLFVIGVVTAILTPIWHLTTTELALLNGASLASAAIGAVFFGFLADKLGRKKMYGIEVVILFIGAILSACATSFTWLLLTRILVGLGIGGDYPSSAVIASEYSHRKNRGFLVLLVFGMQAVGLLVGPLLASFLLLTSVPHDVVWRILLGLGAIPAASVFYLRRKIHETPHFLLSQDGSKLPFEISRVVSDLTGFTRQVAAKTAFKPQSLWQKKWLLCLIGTAGAWFFLDIAFYGNSVSSLLILKALNPGQEILRNTLLSSLVFLCFAVPGYVLAAIYIDRIGRKRLQYLGFIIMTILFALVAFLPPVRDIVWMFIIVFGLSFFFINFGPNTTTFLIPAEIYPTNIRARAHGISAAIGKMGAFVGAFFLPPLLHSYGLSFIFMMMAFVSFAGMLCTLLIPEMKGVALESTEDIVEN